MQEPLVPLQSIPTNYSAVYWLRSFPSLKQGSAIPPLLFLPEVQRKVARDAEAAEEPRLQTVLKIISFIWIPSYKSDCVGVCFCFFESV